MKTIRFFALSLLSVALLCVCACTSSNDEEETPQTRLSTVHGTWQEYAYLNSDGYFTDIQQTGYIHCFDFDVPDTFTEYTINADGTKDISKQGTWTFNTDTQTAYVEEPRGWNLTIQFKFADSDNATLYITGRTKINNSTIKVKRISK